MTMTRMWSIAAGMVVACGLAGSPVMAAPIVYVSPTQQDATAGDPVFVDIEVAGLTEATGGFSFFVSFNGAVLQAVNYTVGAGLGAVTDFSGPVVPGGPFDLYVFSIEDPADLPALQGASFTLARLEFLAVANGLSPVTLSNVELSNADGSATLDLDGVRNGSVCVGGNCVVPEPGSMTLLAIGALAAACRARATARRRTTDGSPRP
jgi:hypothetical protein